MKIAEVTKAMTEKPNSVCKWCQREKGAYVHMMSHAEDHHKFEPVAEPAEPPQPWPEPICKCSLRKSARVHDVKENGEPEMGCHKFEPAEPSVELEDFGGAPYTTEELAEASAEPIAEGSRCEVCGTLKIMDTDASIGAIEICLKCAYGAAPQPVAACEGIAACTQKEACLRANRCLINLPQPVAGEGPRQCISELVDLRCERDYHEKGNHYAYENGKLIQWIQYPPRARALGGTPKLEEIARLIVDSSAEWFWGCARSDSDAKEQVLAILRPFITPACQSPDLEPFVSARLKKLNQSHFGFDQVCELIRDYLATPASTGEANGAVLARIARMRCINGGDLKHLPHPGPCLSDRCDKCSLLRLLTTSVPQAEPPK